MFRLSFANIESQETGKREQKYRTRIYKRRNQKRSTPHELSNTLEQGHGVQCIVKILHLVLEVIAFYGNFIKHCYISKRKKLRGFQFRQSRQAVSNWQILVGPPKNLLVGPGRPPKKSSGPWSALVGPGRPWSAPPPAGVSKLLVGPGRPWSALVGPGRPWSAQVLGTILCQHV